MKKILLVLFLFVFLCGCEGERREYLVSAIGIDKNEQGYTLCFEAIVINTEQNKQSLKLIKGEGETLSKAVTDIKTQTIQPLLLSHCGVIAVGKNITARDLREIGEYCINTREITLSAYLVRNENPQKLLTVKPQSSLSAGYDIMGLVKQKGNLKNRLFEVATKDYKATLPIVSIKDGGLIIEE